ncbi:MAG: hypothetical protein WAW80_03565 [Candidatus Saccharimonadales bacterium]
MNQMLDIDQRDLALKQNIIDLALTDRETFRTQATTALRRLGRDDRKLLKGVASKEIAVYDILSAWHDTLQPLLEQLESKRTDHVFRTSIKKLLILEEKTLDTKINELIDSRISEARVSFIDKIYSTNSDMRYNAMLLLQHPKYELDELLSRFTEYILYRKIAVDNNITLVDAHSWLIRRILNGIKVKRERNTALRNHQERLAYIDKRINELLSQNDGLLDAILKREWDLITIISIRNQYDKRINTLSKKDSASALKRLTLFEELTRKFRDDYVENVVTAKTSLQTTRRLKEEVDTLLLKIFDLSTIQKNQLLIQSKEYRELAIERQSLLQTK